MTDMQSHAAAKPASTGAERVRRVRERKLKDIVLVDIEISPAERDKLVQFKLLAEDKRNDRNEIRKAIHTLFDKMRWSSSNGGKNG